MCNAFSLRNNGQGWGFMLRRVRLRGFSVCLCAIFAASLCCFGILGGSTLVSPEVACADEAADATDCIFISDANDLLALAGEVNSGDSKEGKYYKLAADIDLSGIESWNAIGDTKACAFRGIFDGDGYSITGFTVKSNTAKNGLFGYAKNATFKNLTLKGSMQVGAGNGALVAMTYGGCEFTNIASYVDIVCLSGAGMVGECDPGSNDPVDVFTNCANHGDIRVVGGEGLFGNVGGICGMGCGAVFKNCYNTGDISVNIASQEARAAGIAGGYGACTFINCYNAGKISGTNEQIGAISWKDANVKDGSSNNYYDSEKSGCKGSSKDNDADLSSITAKTTVEMKSSDLVDALNASGAEYVVDDKDANGSYPLLRWELETGAPVISANPVADLRAKQGLPASAISVQASLPEEGAFGSSGSLSYQWYASATATCNPAADTLVEGETSASFVPPTTTAGVAYYYCVVTNSFGAKTVTAVSSPCRVFVASDIPAAKPTITKQPVSAIYKEGFRISLMSVEAEVQGAGAGELSYQWYATDTGSVADGVALDGETDYYLRLGSLDKGTYRYYCVVTNTFEDEKTASVTSDVAVINVVPFTIASVDEYNQFATAVCNGNDFAGITVSLESDLDFENQETEMVGLYTRTSYVTKCAFSGIFDGQGHSISGVNIKRYGEVEGSNVGLFGYTLNAEIKNLKVSGVVSGEACVGGVVGRCEKTSLSSVVSQVNVGAASEYAGGICGYLSGFDAIPSVMDSCINRGTVSCKGETAGGLVGRLSGATVKNCYNRGSVTAQNIVGGIVGSGQSFFIENCFNASSVSISENSSASDYGAIVAVQPGGFDEPGEALVNNHFDETLCSRGITIDPDKVNADYDYGASSVVAHSSDEMKSASFPSVLGSSFVFDKTSMNNGYPVLKFESATWEDASIDTSWYDSSADTFTISTPEQLAGLAAITKGSVAGIARDSFAGKNIVLANDIYLNAAPATSEDGVSSEWAPIGEADAPFCGHFDGAGHTVKNIYIVSGSHPAAGLFGVIDRGALIENVGVTGYVASDSFAGGIVARVTNDVAGSYPVIQKCWNGATVESNTYHSTRGAGGILGGDTYADIPATYSIIDCYNVGPVHARKTAGGIAGVNAGLLMNCYNAGVVVSDAGSGYAGAITATNKQRNAFVENCYYLAAGALDSVGYSENAPSANVTAKTAEELSASDMPEMLSESFCCDTTKINDGWPILLYQAPESMRFLSQCSADPIGGVVYSGKENTPAVVLRDVSGSALVEGVDYEVSAYSNNINAGTAQVKLVGKGNYSGSKVVEFSVEKAELVATYVSERIELGEKPAMAVAVEGFVNGEDATIAAGYKAPVAQAPEPQEIGEFPIAPQGGAADNYVFTYVAGALTVCDPDAVPQFSDVPSTHWIMKEPASNPGAYLTYVVKNGIMTGYKGTDMFGPDDCITREQVATILFRAANPDSQATTDPSQYGTTTSFDDVKTSWYSTAAIEWCKNQGIVGGYSGTNNFGPEDNVTREQLCKMLAEYARVNGEIITNPNMDLFNGIAGHDATSFPGAQEYMAWCVNEGIVSGVNLLGGPNLMPGNTATRAEMAKMMTVLMCSVLGA